MVVDLGVLDVGSDGVSRPEPAEGVYAAEPAEAMSPGWWLRFQLLGSLHCTEIMTPNFNCLFVLTRGRHIEDGKTRNGALDVSRLSCNNRFCLY